MAKKKYYISKLFNDKNGNALKFERPSLRKMILYKIKDIILDIYCFINREELESEFSNYKNSFIVPSDIPGKSEYCIKDIVGKHFIFYHYLTDDNNYIDKECEVYSYDEEKKCFYTSVGKITKDGFFHDLKCGEFKIMKKTEVWK